MNKLTNLVRGFVCFLGNKRCEAKVFKLYTKNLCLSCPHCFFSLNKINVGFKLKEPNKVTLYCRLEGHGHKLNFFSNINYVELPTREIRRVFMYQGRKNDAPLFKVLLCMLACVSGDVRRRLGHRKTPGAQTQNHMKIDRYIDRMGTARSGLKGEQRQQLFPFPVLSEPR